MKAHLRKLGPVLLNAAKHFPAIILTGPRRAGKTFLIRSLFPRADYYLLESPDLIGRVSSDPHGFLDSLKPPVILDEVQNIPGLFASVRALIDQQPRRMGQWFLTGSQESPMMSGAAESMAGRAAILKLLPFSRQEHPGVSLLRGGYPEILALPRQAASLWFSSYLQTYLERDVRSISGVKDLSTYRRFIALVVARHGQMLNRSEIAVSLGVSIPTVSNWLNILEATMQIVIVPPWFENLAKRMVKTPKVFLTDSGMACHLLGIESEDELRRSIHRGPLFEGLVASEILKSQINSGRRPEMYFYRDDQKVEVDFVVPAGNGRMVLFEAKASESPDRHDATSMLRIRTDLLRSSQVVSVDCFVVYPRIGGVSGFAARNLQPDALAMTIDEVSAAALGGGLRHDHKAKDGGEFTRRQERVSEKLAAGLTKPEIAGSLGLSVHTVDADLRSIYGILGVKNGTEAVRVLLEKSGSDIRLSAKQREILELMAAGKRKKEIAAALPMNVHTVDLNFRQIYAALGCRNRKGAVARAVREGLIRRRTM